MGYMMSEMNGALRLAERLGELAARVQEKNEAADIMLGVVVATAPLTVQVEQRLELPEEMLILSAAVTELVPVEDPETGEVYYVPRHTLQQGESVLLAKMSGGAAYVVLERCYATEVR